MSTKGKEYKLAIRIAGSIDKSFTTSLATANTALKRNVLAIDSNFTKLDKGFDKIMGAGKKCFSAIATAAGVATVAIGAATAGAIVVGKEFETAFAGVKKTVDATDAEYEKLKQDILEMSRVLPTSAADIAGVMEIAGQLGIDDYGTEKLKEFTETMINLGVSTNLSAEEAATALAKFANVTKMDPANYERLGSVIVDLGNNFATTEADIVAMATRLASTGNLVGLSEAQIMALATAMSSAGIAAESGGSTMAKLLKKMQLAVETNSDSLADYAAVAGMSGEEFKKAFQDDAVVALSAFIDGVDNVERNGKSAVAVLDDMDLKEVRLSNTILALAGSSENMSDAISTANKAWGENTALAIEAGKRYETVDSKIELMKNSFKELGIAAYDELREPLVDVIGIITDKVHGMIDYVSGPDGISKWLHNIGTELPTLQRKVKKYGGEILNFFSPLIDIGKWFLKNPQVIVSAIAGIGGALAAYKIASTMSHIITALVTLGGMNPVTLTILGLAAAIGGLVGAFTAYKQYERDLINENLREHFGDIALSMEDIQKVAEHILDSESLGGVKKALEEFEDLDAISSTMESSIKELDKMNWKVSIGMELTEEEQGEYKTAIQEYVAAAQEYAQQSQYAVSLNLVTGLEDSEENASIISKVNKFYQDSSDEMMSLGKDLSELVNKAFADNILDPEEMDEIANLQAKIAKLQESLAMSEYDAQLSLLGSEYGGANLTADSFQNLQTELAKQGAVLAETYKESYAKNYASIQAAYDAGEYLSDEEYQKALDNLMENYLQKVSDAQGKSFNFQFDTIMSKYEDEINAVLEKYGDLNGEALFDAVMGDKDFSTTRKSISELLKLMEPTMDELSTLAKQYEDVAGVIPDSIETMFEKFGILKGVTGDGKSSFLGFAPFEVKELNGEAGLNAAREYFNKTGNIFGEISDEMATSMFGSFQESIGEKAVEAIPDFESSMSSFAGQTYEATQSAIEESFSKGFSVETGLNIKINPNILSPEELLKFKLGINNIDHNANGGIIENMELSWLAEKGPEAVIPLDGSSNAISLWEKTGRLLGMESMFDRLNLSGGSSSSPKVEYSPTLQFYGEAPNRDDLESALKVSQDEFEGLMERYFKTHGRVSFG